MIKDLELLYGSDAVSAQKTRYENAIEKFLNLYPCRKEYRIFSASGRTEIGGNHTDHQHGCVLAAAVNLDIVAVLSLHNDGVIRVTSEGYAPFEVNLSDLNKNAADCSTASIVRGVCFKFAEMGCKIGGFDMYCTSNIPSGGGVSSSAAFETLIGTILDTCYNDGRAGNVEIAKIGQFAENVYFDKNSGLMDQTASSVGSLVAIDFLDEKNPKIKKVDFDFEKAGFALCLTDTKGSHADLTPDYDAIRFEMEQIAGYFGKPYLRAVDEAAFCKEIPVLKDKFSERAVLRAMHFFGDNKRAQLEAEALERGDIDVFLALVSESGYSSQNLLQNIYSTSKPTCQELSLAIEMSKKVLNGRGAVRVHGGGFAGTIQAFVPLDLLDEYTKTMNSLFGEGSCMKLRIRPVGGYEIKG